MSRWFEVPQLCLEEAQHHNCLGAAMLATRPAAS